VALLSIIVNIPAKRIPEKSKSHGGLRSEITGAVTAVSKLRHYSHRLTVYPARLFSASRESNPRDQ
jgi:hypothetical protein